MYINHLQFHLNRFKVCQLLTFKTFQDHSINWCESNSGQYLLTHT